MLNLRDPKVVSHSNQRTGYTTTFSEPAVTTVIDLRQDQSYVSVYDERFLGSNGELRSPISECHLFSPC